MSDYKQILEQEIADLKTRTSQAQLPDQVRKKVDKDIVSLERSVELGSYDEKYEKVSRYIEWVLKVPWEKETSTRVDMARAKQVFESHHFGLQEVKDRFYEFLSVLTLREREAGEGKGVRAPVLLLVGLVGTGKTTFAYSLAEALERPIVRIPFGGMGSAKELRGSSRLYLESEPGKIIKGVCEAGVRNPIILLDEIDRVVEEARMDIMGVLVELLDPAQNHAFTDDYLDHPMDLSHALFIATANNTTAIATAVMDRLEKITMPSYTDEEKIVIAQHYVLPKLLEEAGLKSEQISIDPVLWPRMARPLGYDAGIRTLERTLQGLVRKAARIIVERGYKQVVITPQNSNIFMPQY